MITYTKQTTITKPRLEISYDHFPINPREDDNNLGHFIVISNKYHSPDDHPDYMSVIKDTADNATDTANHIQLIKQKIKDRLGDEVVAVYPISCHEHGNRYFKIGTAHGFDTSNNGFYIITKGSWLKYGLGIEYSEAQMLEIIESELDLYNSYVNGEVYCMTLYDENGEVQESVGNFFSLDDIKSGLPKEFANEDMSNYLIMK